MIHGLVSNSSQMIAFMMKSNQERLDLVKQREQRATEQHRAQILAQQAPIYQQIISDNNLSDDIREEAHQALMKLIRGD